MVEYDEVCRQKQEPLYQKAGNINGRTNAFKKVAIVTLKEGDTIDFYSNID